MSVFKRGHDWVSKFQLHGKQHWTPGGPWPTKRQAQEAERRHRDKLTARRSEETVASFADRWLDEWPRPSTATNRNYASAIRHLVDEFGSTPLAEVERLAARTWALTVPRSVSRVAGVMFQDAYNVGLVSENPFSNLRLPTLERKESITAPSMDEYKALLDACTVLGGYGGEFKALIQFAAWTGMRSGEIQALEWADIGEQSIWVRRARKRDGTIGRPKNGKEREIAFLPPARVLDAVPRRLDAYVFHSARGGELVNGSLFYAWREVRAQAGLRTVRFHDLRHFAATQLLELGLDHFAVSVQLGHEDGGALVMQRYGHPSKDAARGRLLAAFTLDGADIGSATGSNSAANGS